VAEGDALGSGANIGEAFDETTGNLMEAAGGDVSGSSTNVGEASDETADDSLGVVEDNALSSGANIGEVFDETTGDSLGASMRRLENRQEPLEETRWALAPMPERRPMRQPAICRE
jgi:hypothetical protein